MVAGTEWSSALTFEGVELGWYWIVVCVSLKNLDYSKLFTMNFLTQRKSAGQDEWYITVRGGGPFFFFLYERAECFVVTLVFIFGTVFQLNRTIRVKRLSGQTNSTRFVGAINSSFDPPPSNGMFDLF